MSANYKQNVPLTTMPWWTSPAGINLGFLFPMLTMIAYVGRADVDGLTIRGIQFLSADYILLGLCLLVVSAVSGWIGSAIDMYSGGARSPVTRWDLGAGFAGLIALGAYLIFFKSFIIHPALFFHTLTGSYRPDRTNIELTVGVTSLVNCGPAFFSIYAYRAILSGVPVRRWMHLMCVVLLGLTALRVYAWSERLALIECIVPFSLAIMGRANRWKSKPFRFMVQAGPFFAVPLFILYFGIAEYVRSWNSSTYHNQTGFWEFAVGRLASYYYTSLNNGAGILSTSKWPSFQFQYTLWWLHKAPLIGPTFSSFVDLRSGDLQEFLEKFGDVEFNNPSGLYSVIFDLGLPGGIGYFAVVGILGGALFRAYRAGSLAGVQLYPMFFLTFLEVFRYPYLGAARTFTWMLGILLIWLVSGFNFRSRPMPALSAACTE
jgi:hypothetical protein